MKGFGRKSFNERVAAARPRVITMKAKAPKRVGRGKHSYLQFDALLSASQQVAAREFFASEDVQESMYSAGTSDGDDGDRKSRITQLGRPGAQPPPEIPAWLDRKLREACKKTHTIYGNKICPLGVDKRGRWTPRFEPVQYAEYAAGGHYRGWHTDASAEEHDEILDLRCVTIVLMLSDQDAYTGGELEVRLGVDGKPSKVPLRAGDAVGFPAKWLKHRVNITKSGKRQTLVYWARRPGTRIN